MDYEKLYKQALEKARKGQSVEQIFPELSESEDDVIIKGIIQYLEQSQFGEEPYRIDDDVVRNYIAWLEKQCKSQQDKDETSDRYAFKFNRVHGYL